MKEFEISPVDADDAPSAVRVEAGDTLSIPSMALRNFKNVGTAPARFLATFIPLPGTGFPYRDTRRQESRRKAR